MRPRSQHGRRAPHGLIRVLSQQRRLALPEPRQPQQPFYRHGPLSATRGKNRCRRGLVL
jgi:hypothetical protein